MIGMSGQQAQVKWNRVFTGYFWKWAAAVLIFLCWSHPDLHSVFSRVLIYPSSPVNEYTGKIFSVRDFTNSRNDEISLSINSIYPGSGMTRNTISANNLFGMFSAGIDTLFLPGLMEVNDVGSVSTFTPSAITAMVSYQISLLGSFFIQAYGYAGSESLSSSMSFGLWGLKANFLWQINSSFQAGILCGYDDLGLLNAEAGCSYKISGLKILMAYELDGMFQNIKGGVEWELGRSIILLFGGQYTLFYNGFVASIGLSLKKFSIWELKSDITAGVTLDLNWNYSFGLGINFSLPEVSNDKE